MSFTTLSVLAFIIIPSVFVNNLGHVSLPIILSVLAFIKIPSVLASFITQSVLACKIIRSVLAFIMPP